MKRTATFSFVWLLLLLLLVGGVPVARAQFPVNQPFTGPTTSAFTLGGAAVPTGTATTPGYLRLTPNATFQAGYAILNGTFPSTQGFGIAFEFFSFGGTGADGFSVFLVDAAQSDPATGQFTIGAFGGALGYAQRTTGGGTNGVAGGYLGIGFDEFGNYSNPGDGHNGGPGYAPQNVALRGPGTGLTGYNYLTGSGSLPFSLSVPSQAGATPEAQAGSPDYRKAFIYVLPAAGGGYTVSVRILHGGVYTTTTTDFAVSAPPANLRIGFAGATGQQTNVHKIRSLTVLQNPYARDDASTTPYTTPIMLDVLANDTGISAPLDPATLDLDPNTAGVQKTFTVPGKGTFTANDAANPNRVTFTPTNAYAGPVLLPYVVADQLGQVSNMAIYPVTVLGADVANTITGPASVPGGQPVTYTVTTSNLGSETATNLTPYLQLPTGLVVPPSPNYTVAANGLVTFRTVTMAAATSLSNAITFPSPRSGATSIAATAYSNYAAGANVPDPVAANNVAQTTTTISAPLPVELTSFRVYAGAEGAALLRWTTASELNSAYFGIEYSPDGHAFTLVGRVKAAGGSSSERRYGFEDPRPVTGQPTYYRLRQVDRDSSAHYSPVVVLAAVTRQPGAAGSASVVLYPNPLVQGAGLSLRLLCTNLGTASGQVELLDALGRCVFTQLLPAGAGQGADTPLALPAAGLPAGLYVVRVSTVGKTWQKRLAVSP